MIAQGTSVMKWSLMNTIIVDSESTNTFGGASHILHWGTSEADVFIINSIIANNPEQWHHKSNSRYRCGTLENH